LSSENGYYNNEGYVIVEPRLIYAPIRGIYGSAEDCILVIEASMQSEGRSYMVGKGFIVVVCKYDCNKVPTYHIRSS